MISTTALAAIESPSGTVIWQKAINGPFTENFNPPLAAGPVNQAVVFRLSGISASSNSTVNGSAVGNIG